MNSFLVDKMYSCNITNSLTIFFFRHVKHLSSCYLNFQIKICKQIIVKNFHSFRSTTPLKLPLKNATPIILSQKLNYTNRRLLEALELAQRPVKVRLEVLDRLAAAGRRRRRSLLWPMPVPTLSPASTPSASTFLRVLQFAPDSLWRSWILFFEFFYRWAINDSLKVKYDKTVREWRDGNSFISRRKCLYTSNVWLPINQSTAKYVPPRQKSQLFSWITAKRDTNLLDAVDDLSESLLDEVTPLGVTRPSPGRAGSRLKWTAAAAGVVCDDVAKCNVIRYDEKCQDLAVWFFFFEITVMEIFPTHE